jgi:hypothetical protein
VLAFLQDQGVSNPQVTVVCTSADGVTITSTTALREAWPGARHMLMKVSSSDVGRMFAHARVPGQHQCSPTVMPVLLLANAGCTQVDVLQADGTVITFDVTVVYIGSPAAANNLVTTAVNDLNDVDNLADNLAAASNGSVVPVQVSSALSTLAGARWFMLNAVKAACTHAVHAETEVRLLCTLLPSLLLACRTAQAVPSLKRSLTLLCLTQS